MAHLDLHEQERLSKIGYFWRDYGKYVLGIIVVAAIGYISSQIWRWNSEKQAADAAIVYAKLTQAINDNNSTEVYNLTNNLEHDFPKVAYTTMASMWAAKIAFANKNYKEAISYLNWVIENAKDKSLIALSKIRLASVYIDQKKFKEARSLLMEKTLPEFAPLNYQARGDLYVAKGDLLKARDAYKEALQKGGQDSALSQVVQLKLDTIGNN